MRKIGLVVSILFTLNASLFSQDAESNPDNFAKMVDFLPPAPNAASIMKYGGIQINKNSGTLNVNIPIVKLSGKNISTEISLAYTSSGIRVDEMASRVGMGWTLLSGGVISRVVRGTPDDVNSRLAAPGTIGFNYATYNFMNQIGLSDNTQGNDSEPDMFSFNFSGYNGSFVFDEQMNITPVESNNYKFYYNFTSPAWNFKIVTADGISYYFGGSGATEKTKRDQICAKLFDSYITTSWYLNKIEHSNGEVITFSYTPLEYTYETGLTQTLYYTNLYSTCASQGCVNQNPSLTTCINLARTKGILLNDILSANNFRVHFDYALRNDCSDRLVSAITLYDLSVSDAETPVKAWDLGYTEVQSTAAPGIYHTGADKTPYLTSLTERDPNMILFLKHQFEYNDPAARPPRVSFAQDHWGYFNGVNNTISLPKPELVSDQFIFPQATANREPNPFYAAKGMLTKIKYPTGGIDSIAYEGNNVSESISTSPSYEFLQKVTGTGNYSAVTKSTTFTISVSQTVKLEYRCLQGSGFYDAFHNKGHIKIVGTSLDKVINAGESGIEYVSLGPGTYFFSIQADGASITTTGTIYYQAQNYSYTGNRTIGGLRVKGIFTSSNDEKPKVKLYYYGQLSSLTVSSNTAGTKPIYIKDYATRFLCNGTYAYCQRKAMYTNTINNIYDYNTTTVSYASVVESEGVNFENGGTQTIFYTGSYAAGQVMQGYSMLNAPKSNTACLLNGKLKEEVTLKQNGSGTLIPIKRVQYNYKLDTRIRKTVYGYAINKKYENNFIVAPDCDPNVTPSCSQILTYCLEAFDMVRYDMLCQWSYVESSVETLYDENGLNPLVNSTNYFYDDTRDLLLRRTEITGSKLNLKKASFKYPYDFPGVQVYTDMIAKNIITPVIYSKHEETNAITSTTTTLSEVQKNYNDWGNGNFAVSTMQKALLGNAFHTEGEILQYDANGNILEYKAKDGITNCFIYGFNYLYPIAKITGASYNAAIGQLSLSVAQLQSLSGTALTDELNKIRLGLTAAQVTTFDYKHLFGINKVVDLNNRATNYEYDILGRLKLIRDNQNFILRKIDYVYAQPDPTRYIHIYYSEAISKPLYSQFCPSDYNPKVVFYSVPAGKYYSYISVADANAKRDGEINQYGQDFANKSGGCANSCTSCGMTEAQKCINEVCVTGVKIVLTSVQQGNQWVCTYKYAYSDGTYSPIYTETTSYYCGLD